MYWELLGLIGAFNDTSGPHMGAYILQVDADDGT